MTKIEEKLKKKTKSGSETVAYIAEVDFSSD